MGISGLRFIVGQDLSETSCICARNFIQNSFRENMSIHFRLEVEHVEATLSKSYHYCVEILSEHLVSVPQFGYVVL